MDRNNIVSASFRACTVALRKESVDRNQQLVDTSKDIIKSLSARRAWIEIRGINCKAAETVKSLSARRAWIEIFIMQTKIVIGCVALRKESVDRNLAWHCMSEDVS